MWKLSMVDSCPPCWVLDDVKTLPAFPIREPCTQSPPVESRKALIWPHMFPKRVGVPNITASAPDRSSRVAIGTLAKAFFASTAPIFSMTSAGRVSGTCTSFTSAPFTLLAPSATASAIL